MSLIHRGFFLNIDTGAGKRTGQNQEKLSVDSSYSDHENNSNSEEKDTPKKQLTKAPARNNSSKRNKLKLDGTLENDRILIKY